MAEQFSNLNKTINESLWIGIKDFFTTIMQIPDLQSYFIGIILSFIGALILTSFGMRKKHAWAIVGLIDLVLLLTNI